MIEFFNHQKEALKSTEHHNKCAYYLDMGLGKTFVGAEKLNELGAKVNLVVCQKSKIDDWIEHFETFYPNINVFNLTNKKDFELFVNADMHWDVVGVINYDLIFRRPELKNLSMFTLMLDESSLIQNENSKRSKFIMKLNYQNLILLSGTPTGGRYEKLWSQLNMLGYKLTKKAFWNMYVNYHIDNDEGFPITIIDGYKNVDRLKRKMREFGCVFMKTEEVFDLPSQTFINIKVDATRDYKKFRKDGIVNFDGVELVGDTTLTKMLYERMLCGHHNLEKISAFKELLESTEDRLIVFYNFEAELDVLKIVCEALERPYSIINGSIKDLYAYNEKSDSVTLIQYQAGAMGLNLQKANKVVYFTPTQWSELFEQSKKRIHRIGQNMPCYYYQLICKNSIEEKIYKTLSMRKDYTDALFEKGE